MSDFCRRGGVFFGPREFVIPEVLIADILSARVTDPMLITLWIANPQGQISISVIFLGNASSRGFVIPEVLIADILSARVTDPLLITLWIANPQGLSAESLEMNDSSPVFVIVSVLVLYPLFSGICNPRGSNCGYSIRAGHRPAINHPVDCKSTGTKFVLS